MTTSPRARARHACLAAAGLLAAGACAHTPAGLGLLPTTAGSRISDEAIAADHHAFRAIQGRLQILNEGGRPLGEYHLAKAQAYLDLAFDEYHENDRSGVVEAAMSAAIALVDALERRAAEPPAGTPPLRGEARLRPDLWARADALKRHRGFSCAGATVARLEVTLLHAGHEARQGGWRRAVPHIEIAEDLAGHAATDAEGCTARDP